MEITLSKVIRWIVGLLFLLVALGTIIQGQILAFIFAVLIAIVCIPLISEPIENAINLKMSGPVRFVLVFVLLCGMVVVTPHPAQVKSADVSAAPSDIKTSSVEVPAATPAIQDENVCQWDWTYTTTASIGQYNVAPSGSKYVVVKIYLKNNADQSISTNPYLWDFTTDGIKYTLDSATFSQEINHQSVDVGKGGEMETEIVYVVKGDPNEAVLSYNGFSGPKMERIKHY